MLRLNCVREADSCFVASRFVSIDIFSSYSIALQTSWCDITWFNLYHSLQAFKVIAALLDRGIQRREVVAAIKRT